MTTTPTTGPVSSHFGARKPPKLPDGTFGSSWHNGTDLSAPTGQPVVAPQAGTVALAEFNTVRGTNVIVDHGRYRTRHQHLHSMTVTVGQGVAEGQVIGTVGNTGSSSGAHLHTEVHDGTTPIDPEPWYAARGVTLGVAMAVLSEHEEDDMYTETDRLTWRADMLEEARNAVRGEVADIVARTAAAVLDSDVGAGTLAQAVRDARQIARRTEVAVLALPAPGTVTVGNLDYAALAKAVNDDAARRLAE